MEGPLEGVRIVDLSSSYAGPTATMYLADLGAAVLKVEAPVGGDDARGWGPPFAGSSSAWFTSANRNKRSIAIDIRNDSGKAVLRTLIGKADVLIQAMSPPRLAEFGLDPETIRAAYPRLIYCAISGLGQTGPDAGLPGYDLIAQARSGIMSVTGPKGGPPQRVSTALSDITTGLIAAFAIVAALRRAERTGQGDFIDVSLLDADLALMAPRIASYLAGEPEPAPSGGTDSVIAIYQTFETADRPIVVAIGNDRIWARFCECLDLAEFSQQPELATNAGRAAHRAAIVAAVAERLVKAPAAAWLERFGRARIPTSLIQSLSEIVADRQVVARHALRELYIEGHGPVRVLGLPWRAPSLDGSANRRDQPPPAVGQHTVEILREHMFSEDEIDDMLRLGAVWAAPANASENKS